LEGVTGGFLCFAGTSAFLLLHYAINSTNSRRPVEQREPQLVSRLMARCVLLRFIRDEAGDPEHGAQQYLDIDR